ncbi:MAG: rhodanese-like domain-containing protein, partial [Chitinophagales bacterium]
VCYDHALCHLQGGFNSWKNSGKEIDTIQSISVDEFADIQAKDASLNILDVRKASENFSERIEGSVNATLDYINESMKLVDKNKTYYVHCAGGYRSMVFASILKARGYDNLIDIAGGFNAIKASGKFKTTDYVCPSTML